MNRFVVILFTSLGLMACATVPPAGVPVIDSSANAAAYRVCPNGQQIRKNKPCPGVAPTFSAQNSTVTENAGNAVVTVTKSGTTSQQSTINYATANGTAISGVNYSGVSGAVTVAASQSTFNINVPLIDNQRVDPTLTFSFRLTAGTNAVIGNSATISILDNDAGPPPPPPSGLAGEVTIADNWTTSTGIEQTWYGPTGRGGLAPASADPVGAFRILCGPGQLLRDDPLVNPGAPGASLHLHQFFGNAGANGNSTYNSLRTTGGTTCGQSSTPINRSAYWTPAMLDGVGHVVKPDYFNLYYKRNPISDPKCNDPTATTGIGQCVDLPNGIRFIFGTNMTTGLDGPTDLNSQNHDAITFQCWDSEDGLVISPARGYYHSIEEVRAAGCPAGARLMIIAAAPNCWNGTQLDGTSHRGHIAFSSGTMYPGQFFRACLADHPYVLPNLEVQEAYTTDANFVTGLWELDSDRQMCDVMAMCAPVHPHGWTWHMDYWEAWSPTVKATWHGVCINQKLSCSGGDLGNGTQIIGGSPPPGGFPKHQLVPIP